jgi:GntR family transcriptional repressor for pyruvate dehydrogenase complex
MSLEVKPVSRTRVSDQIANQLLTLIQQGHLQPGQRIPGEHELSKQFATSRSSIREALGKLEYIGVLEIRNGSGAYVTKWPLSPEDLTEKLAWVVERRDLVLKLLQVREVLQGLGARLCAELAGEAQVDEMALTLEEMEQAGQAGDLEAVTEADTRFHYLIGECAGNEIANELIRPVEEAYRSSSRALMDLRGRAGASIIQHAQIIDAIRNQQPDLAEEAMRNHISSVRLDLIKLAYPTGEHIEES